MTLSRSSARCGSISRLHTKQIRTLPKHECAKLRRALRPSSRCRALGPCGGLGSKLHGHPYCLKGEGSKGKGPKANESMGNTRAYWEARKLHLYPKPLNLKRSRSAQSLGFRSTGSMRQAASTFVHINSSNHAHSRHCQCSICGMPRAIEQLGLAPIKPGTKPRVGSVMHLSVEI